jgi:hypothetical protein
MSTQITEAMKVQYASNFIHLAQQRKSRLESCVMIESGIVGESKSVERVGKTAAQIRTTRHGDTPLIETPFSKRWLDLADYEWADLIDQQDKIRTIADPTSDTLKAGVMAMERAKDAVVYASLGAAARTKASTAALPAGQKIVHGSAGLTKAKIIEAKKKFRANEADEESGEELFFIYNSVALEDLLNDTTLTSADYMAVQMLQSGKVERRWMGFTWVPYEPVTFTSSTYYLYAWAKTGVSLGIGADIKTRLTERDDKSYAVQPYCSMSLGAVRVEEEKVVEVQIQ